MILKASTRGGAKQLAQHLLSDENDHVTVHTVEGFMSEDVESAFQEMYAISRGTKCKKFMFSLSLNPPPNELVSTQDFENAIEQVEEKLNLKNQPKVVIFHEKGSSGRNRHCHCVWSRIDADEMKAIEMNYFKRELTDIAKGLFIEHGWQMPSGYMSRDQRDPRNFSLEEWQQAKRNNLNPKQIKTNIQRCWETSDDKKSFIAALTNNGFFLARGDRRGFVVIDWNAEVYSLSRSLNGVKAKELKKRLGEPDQLATVKATQSIIATAHNEAHEKLQSHLSLRHKHEVKPLNQRMAALLKSQRQDRIKQREFHKQRQVQELQKRKSEYRMGMKGIWDFVTGKRRQIKKIHEKQLVESNRRDVQEREKLISEQLEDRKAVHAQLDSVRQRQQKEAMKLNADFVKRMKDKELSLEFTESHNLTKTEQSFREQVNNQHVTL